jgi:type IV secretory pathway VirB2 component (pilin)
VFTSNDDIEAIQNGKRAFQETQAHWAQSLSDVRTLITGSVADFASILLIIVNLFY